MMKYYKSLKFYFVLFIILHTIISLLTGYIFKGRTEVFPFFNWQLFAQVPHIKTEYIIKVISYRGETFVPSENYFQSNKFFKNKKRISNYYLIQKLGESVNKNDRKDIEHYSSMVGSIIFDDHDVEFQILKRVPDPSVKSNDDNHIKYETIATMRLNNNESN